MTTLAEEHHEWLHHGDHVRVAPDIDAERLRASELLAFLDEAVEKFNEQSLLVARCHDGPDTHAGLLGDVSHGRREETALLEQPSSSMQDGTARRLSRLSSRSNHFHLLNMFSEQVQDTQHGGNVVSLRRSAAPGRWGSDRWSVRLEAADPTVERMPDSPDAQGRTMSAEAIYQYIYAMPRGELARRGIFLQSKRTKRRPRRRLGYLTPTEALARLLDGEPHVASTT